MADTVKKSRIVSENECLASFPEGLTEDTSLQDIINEEFNQRLKNCMRDEPSYPEPNYDHIALSYEPGEAFVKNGMNSPEIGSVSVKNGLNHNENDASLNNISNSNLDVSISPDDIDNFVNKEIPSPEDELESPFDNITVTDVDSENLTAKERFLSTVSSLETELNPKLATVKDRMFLSTDSACLLFTQTVVQSPMLTPTDESYDFLKGLKQNSSQSDTNVTTLLSNENDDADASSSATIYESKEVSENDENVLINEHNDKKIIEPENLEILDNEDDKLDVSEISEANEVCRQSSVSENDISETFSQSHEIETEIEAEENSVKEVTVQFLEHEKAATDSELNLLNSPMVIEHLIEDTANDATEIDDADENKKAVEDVIPVEAVEAIGENNETKAENKSPSKVSEISKIFTSNEEKEELKSIIVLEETFENIKKTKEIFEKNSSPECDTNKFLCFNELSSTVTSESTFVETRTESNSSQDKVLKKKKSKKSKKDSEKENISVCDNNHTNDEELSHVSVKNLCRSFSDLTSISSKFVDVKIKGQLAYGRTKSMSDIRREEHNLENVFSHVSVKSLRECFDNLTNRTNNRLASQKPDNLLIKTVIKTSDRIEQLKSSFSKFDALQKKTVLHVRSSDSGKAQEKFNGTTQLENSNCKACAKQVFQMEQIKAEKAIWHKNCFRCKECNKQLNVDTYQSNEGVLYCKPHFKALFAPKVIEEDQQQPIRPKKHELIIRENQPLELPPDVVRASDKPDLGLEELQNLNVKERFQVFEHHENQENNLERTPSAVNVKRSPSILSKLAKFQSKGMDVGVSDDALNGVPVEESSTEEEEEEEEEIDGEDADLVRARKAQREKPLHFNNMSDIMSKWESGHQMTREERREERKQEIQSIRSRLFMGKQAKIKEMYQQAVAESESGAHIKKQVPLESEIGEGAKALRDKFERGEPLTSDEQQKLNELEDDRSVFESGISKKSRSIFLELDANASKAPQLSPLSPSKSGSEVRRAREAFMNRQASEDVVRSTDQVDDVTIKTADISSRFKFFETYKEPEKQRKQFRITPPREGQVKMPDSPEQEQAPVVESDEPLVSATASHTATRMLNVFRQMEENQGRDNAPAGPRPLKCFTPPPEPLRQQNETESEEYSSEEEEEEDEHDNHARIIDEDLIEAQKAARAKQLRAKFEKWEANEIKREQNNSSVNIAEELGEGDSQIESAKSLRARFESMKETNAEKERTPRVKVNRFVDTTNYVEMCKSCEGRVYPLEKVSCHNNVYHKNCFRCRECNTVLRLDSYTYNQGLLYCLPHFKRLFISKGNYEAGFGLDQHKEKWNAVA